MRDVEDRRYLRAFEPLVYRREWLPPNGWWRKEVALREAGRHEEADRYHAAMVADHDDE